MRTCNICVKIFQNKTEYKEHKNLEHKASSKERTSKCHLCDQTFLHKNYLQSHIKLAHTKIPAEGICGQCDKTFDNRYQLAVHKQRKHRERKSSCEYCELKFYSDISKEQHVKRQHLKQKNVACDKCPYKGFAIDNLRIHTINKHSDFRPYTCKLCPMAFPRVTSLYQHTRTHENKTNTSKDFPCQICGKAFKNKGGSDRCKTRHQSEGMKCSFDDCDATFVTKHLRKKHQKESHTSGDEITIEDVHPCHNCDKSFKHRPDLKRHIKYVHDKPEAKTPCSICPKMFVNEKVMKRHRLVHDDSIFKCPYEGCEVTHKLQYNLNHHYKQKHGKVNHRKSLAERMAREKERNQQIMCDLCQKWIKKDHGQKGMNSHLKTHANKSSMQCIVEGCLEDIYFNTFKDHHTYNLPSQFYEHLTKHHKVNMNTHTVCVDFKCKNCDQILSLESSMPMESSKFWC